MTTNSACVTFKMGVLWSDNRIYVNLALPFTYTSKGKSNEQNWHEKISSKINVNETACSFNGFKKQKKKPQLHNLEKASTKSLCRFTTTKRKS